MRKKKDEERKPIEQEIAELQRKFRLLENNKRAYSEDSQGIIRKQRATIEKLTRENKKMKSELNETRGVSASGPEKKMALETVSKLTEQNEKLKEKLEQEEETNDAIAEQLNITTKRVFMVREEMAAHGGVNASLDNAKATQKQIRVLENRLDKGLQTFNEAIAANKELREQIDTLRRESYVFRDIHKKLENELAQKKKEMASIIEQANAAYEARDSAQAQMAALKQQADKEHSEFEKEWRELGRLIDNDRRMKDFMQKKVKNAKEDASKSGEMSPKDETHKKRLTKRESDTARSQTTTATQEKVAAYEEAFARIQAATGICDIDELVQTFVNGEDQNFGLFKYNNLLSADIEKLETQIAEYNEQYETLSGSSNREEDTERLKVLESLDKKWKDIGKKADRFDTKYQSAQFKLQVLRDEINDIFFEKLKCDPKDLPAGCGAGISESNMMAYLGVIEKRANVLLKAYDQNKGDDDDFDPARTTRPANSTTSMPSKLPSTVEDYSDDEDEEDDEDNRPFTWKELKAKTLKGITRKAKRTKMKGVAAEK